MAIQALRIGIEIEVVLCAKRMQDRHKTYLVEFAEGLIQYYNSKAKGRPGEPKMNEFFDQNFRYWSIMEDGSIGLNKDHYKGVRPCEISGSFAILC